MMRFSSTVRVIYRHTMWAEMGPLSPAPEWHAAVAAMLAIGMCNFRNISRSIFFFDSHFFALRFTVVSHCPKIWFANCDAKPDKLFPVVYTKLPASPVILWRVMGWQAKMASVEFWISWRIAKRLHWQVPIKTSKHVLCWVPSGLFRYMPF